MKKRLYAVLIAGSLMAATAAQASFVTLTNGDFDSGAVMTGNFTGFDTTTDIAGWINKGDVPSLVDSGVQDSVAWWGVYDVNSAFMKSGDGTYNLSSYVIRDGDLFTVDLMAKGWLKYASTPGADLTVTLFYGTDSTTNAIGSFSTGTLPQGDNLATWTAYRGIIAATAGSVGQTLGILVESTGPANTFANFDEVEIRLDPFTISVSPTGVLTNQDATIEATIDNINGGTFVSATLSLDGNVVANNNTPSGTTRTLSHAVTGLSNGVHTGAVVAVSSTESMTNSWTFEIRRPPFGSITTTPTGWISSPSTEIQAVIVEEFSIVDSVEVFVDGNLVSSTLDRSAAPTTTVSAAVSGLTEGAHTARIIVMGSPAGVETNEWAFNVQIDDTSHPISIRHHWDFNETSGNTAADSVGNADGTVFGVAGSNFTWTGSAIDLPGGGSSGAWNSTNSSTAGGYVDLPNGIISALPATATFEAVFVADTATGWMRLWDFGTSASGENISDGATQTFFLTPLSGPGTLRMAVNNGTGEFLILDSTRITGQLVHLVCTYDSDGLRSSMYVNGKLVTANLGVSVSFGLASLTDVNNWLGRAQYNDPMFNGQIDDFRIYSGIMTSAEVAARYDEVLNGGGPTVSPVIQSIAVSGGQVTLSWTAEDKGTYSVLRKTDLTSTTWTPVLTGLPAGNLTTNVDASGSDQEFYQVEGQ